MQTIFLFAHLFVKIEASTLKRTIVLKSFIKKIYRAQVIGKRQVAYPYISFIKGSENNYLLSQRT